MGQTWSSILCQIGFMTVIAKSEESQYWLSAVASNAEEDYELRLWMLNLFAHYVAVNKNWFETADESKYWGKLFLSEEDWEVPPPPLAITSEKNSYEYH